jgi:hypothetical protein
LRAAVLTVGLVWSWTAVAIPADTAGLAAQLRAVRGKKWLTVAEYARLQTQYLGWIDARVQAARTIESMNRELRAAGLFPPRTDPMKPYLEAYAGYLDEISTPRIRAAAGLLAIAAGIYKGGGCALDETVILYQREPLRKLAQINAAPDNNESAYYLAGLDVGETDASSGRLVASGWGFSNCTSTWNGQRIRIDRLKEISLDNVLARDLDAQNREENEDVAAWVRGDVVTFWYQGGTGDGDLLSAPAIARYRVAGNRAVRERPVALTRAGFIHEWLEMDGAEAARWSEPEAEQVHPAVARAFADRYLEWAHVGRCAGSPPVWEVGVRIHGSQKLYVFRIGGSQATGLRMLAVTDQWTGACEALDIRNNLESVGAELAW